MYGMRRQKGSLLLTEAETFLCGINYLKVAIFCKTDKHQPTVYDFFFKFIWRYCTAGTFLYSFNSNSDVVFYWDQPGWVGWVGWIFYVFYWESTVFGWFSWLTLSIHSAPSWIGWKRWFRPLSQSRAFIRCVMSTTAMLFPTEHDLSVWSTRCSFYLYVEVYTTLWNIK